MTTQTARVSTQPEVQSAPAAETSLGTKVVKYLTTTDHKVIGNMYLVTSMLFFMFGGVLALFIRAELANPGLQLLNFETYNQFFTMHGTIMLLMFATPLFAGFANALIPLTPFRELAFAMTVGILVDAFLVRSLLVPALLILVGPASGWPGPHLKATRIAARSERSARSRQHADT